MGGGKETTGYTDTSVYKNANIRRYDDELDTWEGKPPTFIFNKSLASISGIDLDVSHVRLRLESVINTDIDDALQSLRTYISLERDGGRPDLSKLSNTTKKLLRKAHGTFSGSEWRSFPHFRTARNWYNMLKNIRINVPTHECIALASSIDYIVQSLMRTTMVNAHKQDNKIITPDHIINGEPVEFLNVVKNDKIIDNNLLNNFKYSVSKICKSVKASLVVEDDYYNCILTCPNIRKFGASIIIQLIEQVAYLISHHHEPMDITAIINTILTKAECTTAGINKFVSDRLATFSENQRDLEMLNTL